VDTLGPEINRDRLITYIILGVVIFTILIADLGTFIFSGGINVLLIHLFYFPVIFAAIQYPKKGILFATVCALLYVSSVFLLTFPNPAELVSATMQFYVLISLGVAVSVMSGDLQLSELKYRSIFSNAGNGICMVNAASGSIVEANAQCSWMLGKGSSPVFPTNLEQILPDADERDQFLHRLRAGEIITSYEVRTTDAEGPEYNLLVSARLLPNDVAIMTLTDITERKRNEAILRESERKYRELADLLPQPVFEFDQTGIFTFANRNAFKTFGYNPDDLTSGLHVLNAIALEDREKAWNMISKLLHDDSPNSEYAVEYKALRKDGSTFPMVIYASPIFHLGEPVGVRGVVIDITERRQAEEHDREYMGTLEFLSRTATDFVQLPADADIYQYISDRFVELFPGSANVASSIDAESNTVTVRAAAGPEPLLNLYEEYRRRFPKGLSYTIPPEVVGEMLSGDIVEIQGGIAEASFGQLPSDLCSAIDLALGDGKVYGIGFQWDGQLFGASVVFLPEGVALESPDSMPAFIHQISIALQRRKVEAELRESEEKYRLLFEGSSDGVFVMTETFLDCNEKACDLWGYSRNEMIGRSPADFSPVYQPDGRLSSEVAQERIKAALSGVPQSFSWQLRRKDGTLIDAEISLKSLTVHGRQVLFATMRDVTERNRAEKALQKANRKLHLLSSVTRHDILNQITGIVGYLEFLKESVPPNTADWEHMERISEMTRTIQRQITFTRDYEDMGMEAPQWQRIDAVVRTVVSTLGLSDVDLKVETGPLEVFADPMMEKVFFNLMENSIRHGEQVNEIRISFRQVDGIGIIIIQDNGVGIPHNLKEKVFQRGFGKNTGFGLFLAREILSITGIAITETGEEGMGARFEIAVPEGTYRTN
jgi:PAS domain S-box-containing protein